VNKTESAVMLVIYYRSTWALWAYGPYDALYKLTFYLLDQTTRLLVSSGHSLAALVVMFDFYFTK